MHNNKKKILAYIIIVIGLSITATTLLSDVIRKRISYFGPAQVLFLVIGLLITLFGFFVNRLNFHKIYNALKLHKIRIVSIFSLISGCVIICSTLLSDLISKRTYHIEPAQIVFIFLGLTAMLYGFFLPKVNLTIQRVFNILIISGFLFYAILFFWGKWNGIVPIIDLSSDSAAISGWSVASMHPENFYFDTLMGKSENLLPYQFFLIPAINLLSKIFRDSSFSFTIFLPVSIFLQLVGFYLLGKKIFRRDWLALLLSILCAFNIPFGAGDYWGIFRDPQPRFIFQSIFPYLLLFFFNSIDEPKRWPFLMFFIGLTGNIHVLSDTAIGLMVWVSFFFNKPKYYSWKKMLLTQLLNGVIYLITSIPILLILNSNFSFDYFVNVPLIINNYFDTLLSLNIIIMFFISFTFIFIFYHKIDPIQKNLVIWLLTLLFYSLIVPFMEFNLHKSGITKTIIPIDVIRNLRYTFPVFFIVIFYNFHQICVQMYEKNKGLGIPIIMLTAVILVFTVVEMEKKFKASPYYFADYAKKAVICFASGNYFCPSRYEANAVEVLNFIRNNTNYSTKILAAPYGKLSEQIRYGAERTSSFVIFDSGRQHSDYANQDELEAMFNQLSLSSGFEQIQQSINFACYLKSDLILFNPVYSDDLLRGDTRIDILFRNENFVLTSINSCSLAD